MCKECGKVHGTIMPDETELQAFDREMEWREGTECPLCGCYFCDGHCEDGGY